MQRKRLSRREFMIKTGMSAAGAGLLTSRLGRGAAFGETAAPEAGRQKAVTSMQYRTLGRTGLRVSAVALGAMRLTEPAVLYKALDLGVNYIDTANSYQNGNNEKLLGDFLKDYGRKKVLIATKIHPFHFGPNPDGTFRMLDRKDIDLKMEKSLKRLRTDYVDVLFIHNIMDTGWPLDERILAFLEQVKKDGKARYVGMSIHDPRYYVDVANTAASSGKYDVLLAWLNFKSIPEHIEALRKARKANVGIVAMKTQAGGYTSGATAGLSPQQAALRWVLDQDCVDCAIPGMVNIDQVVENVGSLAKKTTWHDRKTLHTYYRSIRHQYCIMCGGCSASCPVSVNIHAINRALMYYEGYGDFVQARSAYQREAAPTGALECLDCTSPTCSCVRQIDLPARVRYARELFA